MSIKTKNCWHFSKEDRNSLLHFSQTIYPFLIHKILLSNKNWKKNYDKKCGIYNLANKMKKIQRKMKIKEWIERMKESPIFLIVLIFTSLEAIWNIPSYMPSLSIAYTIYKTYLYTNIVGLYLPNHQNCEKKYWKRKLRFTFFYTIDHKLNRFIYFLFFSFFFFSPFLFLYISRISFISSKRSVIFSYI